MPRTSITSKDVDREYARLQTIAVPINGLSFEHAKGPTHIGLAPIVYIDPAERPDVADLARVHRTDGLGDTRTRWGLFKIKRTIEICLEIRFSAPVDCQLCLFFPVATKESPVWLWLIMADTMKLMGIVCADDPSDTKADEGGMFIELQGQSLLQMLGSLSYNLWHA